jgi:hypothetical protein
MEAQNIDKERFGGEFPESQKIESGDVIEARIFKDFETKAGLQGVSITDIDGKLWHTTAKQPVGYIRSPNVGLAGLVEKAEDSAVTLFFSTEKPTNSNFNAMLKCSIFKPRA